MRMSPASRSSTARPDWQLPEGVSHGTWDYLRSDAIATGYDDYFADAAIFAVDAELVSRYIQPPSLVVDLGCGTGRSILPLVQAGCRGIAIDLSAAMLGEVKRKADALQIGPERLLCVQANLVELNCLADESIDHALCLFSTLGMIRGADPRQRVVAHVRRILRPGGYFVLQVHNYWVHLFDPEGPWWMVRNWARRMFHRDVQIGDKFFPYRGIPRMFLHTFSRRELHDLLRSNGFRVRCELPLNATQSGELAHKHWFPAIRASGWIMVCQSDGLL